MYVTSRPATCVVKLLRSSLTCCMAHAVDASREQNRWFLANSRLALRSCSPTASHKAANTFVDTRSPSGWTSWLSAAPAVEGGAASVAASQSMTSAFADLTAALAFRLSLYPLYLRSIERPVVVASVHACSAVARITARSGALSGLVNISA